MKKKKQCLFVKKQPNRSVKYTPADTKVAECIKADAGIGASIESGNQKKNKNWADFIKAAVVKKNIKKSPYLKLVLFL